MTVDKILKMNPEYPTDIAMALEEHISNKTDKLSQEEDIFLKLYWFEMDFGSSGLSSYFYNNGEEINQVLEYLKLVNATYMYELLTQAISVFPNSIVPDDLDKVLNILDKIDNDDTNALWDKLEEKYFNEHESELFIYLINYVKNNLNKFK